ncbi:hypothetical protein HK105_202240 [Polyrhizophydium stewartii]|uniref:Uncharacterized protein n=1 Tax=Polyrhizophydium stewartii TaxID=2732419 RepID=A0ABR4NFK3_9FUNG
MQDHHRVVAAIDWLCRCVATHRAELATRVRDDSCAQQAEWDRQRAEKEARRLERERERVRASDGRVHPA